MGELNEHVSLNIKNIAGFVSCQEMAEAKGRALIAADTLVSGTGAGSEYTGWLELPVSYDREEYARIKKAAERIRSDSEILVVIGIGGSYLGAKAAVEFLSDGIAEFAPSRSGKKTQVVFAGNSLSGKALSELIGFIGDRDFSLNIISKSGTTTEPAAAFRILKEKLVSKYGSKGAAARIYATTDACRGTLRAMAEKEGYESFVVPDNIGGRYSVLTAVGLLPIAAAGIDTDALFEGAAAMRTLCLEKGFVYNDALRYAALRNILYDKGFKIELLTSFEPCCHYISEWWKQLFGESEGKNGRGLFPASCDFTTDLHSMGQLVQDGPRILFETVLDVKDSGADMPIGPDGENGDFLAGLDMESVNRSALEGTVLAHSDGGVPVMRLTVPRIDAFYLGELFYFFEFACGISAYMLGVNPFDQPGVEMYKNNMFALLGRPGFETLADNLRKRI